MLLMLIENGSRPSAVIGIKKSQISME